MNNWLQQSDSIWYYQNWKLHSFVCSANKIIINSKYLIVSVVTFSKSENSKCWKIKGSHFHSDIFHSHVQPINMIRHTTRKMSFAAMQISVIRNKREKFNAKPQKVEQNVKRNLKVLCLGNFNEYLYHSTLHGLKYVGDRKISRLER